MLWTTIEKKKYSRNQRFVTRTVIKRFFSPRFWYWVIWKKKQTDFVEGQGYSRSLTQRDGGVLRECVWGRVWWIVQCDVIGRFLRWKLNRAAQGTRRSIPIFVNTGTFQSHACCSILSRICAIKVKINGITIFICVVFVMYNINYFLIFSSSENVIEIIPTWYKNKQIQRNWT